MSSISKILAGLLVAVAVILGVVAIRMAMKPAPAPAPAPQETAPVAAVKAPEQKQYPVVVAARDLEPGVAVGADDFRLEMWPVAPALGFTQIEPLQGERLREALPKGGAVTQGMLSQGLSRYLEEGERAVAIAVDEAFGGFAGIQPGDLVDVFFTVGRGNENQNTQARLLLPSVRVLAFGQDSLDGPVGEEPQKNRKASAARNAMLAVPLTEVNGLLLAMGNGKLQLALRSPDDVAQPDTNLFAERSPVLRERDGLTPEEQALLESAENVAYAGDSMSGLTASEEAQGSRAAGASGKGGGRSVQVIRGRQNDLHHY